MRTNKYDVPQLVDLAGQKPPKIEQSQQEMLKILEVHAKFYERKPAVKQESKEPAKELPAPPKPVKPTEELDPFKQKIMKITDGLIQEATKLTEEDHQDTSEIQQLVELNERDILQYESRSKNLEIKLGTSIKTQASSGYIAALQIEQKLVAENIESLKKIQLLYQDKINMRKKIEIQLKIISQLVHQNYDLQYQFYDQIKTLRKFNDTLPRERELFLEDKVKGLEQELLKYYDLEQRTKMDRSYMENVQQQLKQAQTIIVEQLKQIRSVQKGKSGKTILHGNSSFGSLPQEEDERIIQIQIQGERIDQLLGTLKRSQNQLKQQLQLYQ